MKDGFIRVAAATPDLKVADPMFNWEQTWKMMQGGSIPGCKDPGVPGARSHRIHLQ